MTQEVHTAMMAGGLDLVSPPIVMPPGKVIAGVNYEPDAGGYTSMGGYERFDGHDRPSDSDVPSTIAARRAAISAVPGTGPVRGVWVFDGSVYAFRDQDATSAGMFKATAGGWEQQAFGSKMFFSLGTAEFVAGEIVVGATSTANAMIDRVVLRNGAWSGTAEGYLILSDISGTFAGGEIVASTSGSATGAGAVPIAMTAGGKYDFTNHNFYGSAERASMYFVSGVDTAYEWTGTILTPVHTGTSEGALTGVDYLLAPEATIAAGEFILAADGSSIIVSATTDAPTFISHYKNHLFLGYSSGSIINSSIGEPLEYSTTSGAGEISFGEQITGLMTAAATSLVIFAQNHIEYLTGTDSATFQMQPISEASGAQPYTTQMMDAPMFLDDGGIRTLPTTAAFGDWRMGTVTQLIERLMRQKRDAGVSAVASQRIKGKDQYRLYWSDQTGITVYIGRKNPEALPFRLPIQVFCACSGEVQQGYGDRLFCGGEDGYVYEMNRGTSYDGAVIDTYIRLPFNSTKSPSQHTRWMKATFEIDTPDDITMGVAFDVDYAKGIGGAASNVEVDAGSAIVTTDAYGSVDWTQPVEGRLEYHLNGIGPNIAATLITSAADKEQHTLASQTYNFSRRRLKR